MSFILDALRKAEQERNLGQPPDLQKLPTIAQPSQRPIWPWLIVLILLVNVVVVGVWLLRPGVEKISDVALDSSLPVATTAETAINNLPVDKPIEVPVVIASQQLSSDPVPTFQTLPRTFRENLPALNLDIHVYSELPSRRFVLINSKRYQQGDWLDEGPLLEAISPDGVILNYQEQRFSLVVQQ